ncbi:MAG: insulinase family protein [Pseudomonadota bacterium]|nr:insulinase family protein [Pseudomonadota bacterium]
MAKRAWLLLALWPVVGLALPKIETWNTANGARVYFVRAPELPMVDLRVAFDAGSARDQTQWGLAGLTNGMLAEGAGGLTAQTLSERFEATGAQFNNSSGREMASVGLRSLTESPYLERAVETLGLVLQKPDFPAEALERQRKLMLTALKQREQDPAAIAEDRFMGVLYQDHPYGSPPHGSAKTLGALKRDDLLAHYRRYYCGRNAVIGLVGDLTRPQAASIAEKLVATLPEGAAAPPLPPALKIVKPIEIHVPYPSSQTHIWAGRAGFARLDPDYFPLYLGNHVLGGGGFISRLYKEVREKRGLSYSVYSYFQPMRVAGPFIAGLQTSFEQADQALSVMRETLTKFVADGPSATEMEASVKNIAGGFPLRIDSSNEVIEYLILIGFYGLPLDFLDTYVDHIRAVTLLDIGAAFKRRMDPPDLITVTVGPKGKPPPGAPAPPLEPAPAGRHH